MDKFDFGWGEPHVVREALDVYYAKFPAFPDIKNMGYSGDEGDPRLVELTKQFIKYTTGENYKYVIITNGTIPSINTVLRTMKEKGKNIVQTHPLYFGFYNEVIRKSQMSHIPVSMKGFESRLHSEDNPPHRL